MYPDKHRHGFEYFRNSNPNPFRGSSEFQTELKGVGRVVQEKTPLSWVARQGVRRTSGGYVQCVLLCCKYGVMSIPKLLLIQ